MTEPDYISHHFDATYRAKLFGAQKNTMTFTTTENPKSSRGMSGTRLFSAFVITVAHIFALIAVYDMFFVLEPVQALRWVLVSFAFYYITGTMGITAGAHRLWAHRSYRASLPARIFLMLVNSIVNQASIITWCMEHRIHHTHVDTDADPHNINRGFFFAHMGWLFSPRTDAFVAAKKSMTFDDLYADPVLRIQDKYYAFFGPFFCYVFPTLLGWYFAGDAWRGYIYLAMFRWVVTLHATWTVNSIAHTMGRRPYRPDIKASEHALVSFFSGGEGWHNYHHAFPWDYAASEGGTTEVSWRFNTARFWIDSLAALGLVSDRKIQRNPYRAPLESVDQQIMIPKHMRDHVLAAQDD